MAKHSQIKANGIASLKDIVDEWVSEFGEGQFDSWVLMWWEYDTGDYHHVELNEPAALFIEGPRGDGQFVVMLIPEEGVVDSV